MVHMIDRIQYSRLQKSSKSLLLLGPRQVGKSTLCKGLKPDLFINLASQRAFQEHLKDPGLIERLVAALPPGQLILIDEIQRIPQSLILSKVLLTTQVTGFYCRVLLRAS